MKFLIYSLVSMAILFLSYRISLSKALIFSISAGIFILIREVRAFPYEAAIYVLFISALPIIAERFRKDFNRHKDLMRTRLEETKRSYEEFMHENKREIGSNIEREKKLQQVLSLYEISKDMSSCLIFEDMFNIFFATLKRSFRFSFSRLVLLKDSNDIDLVYQIELGQRVSRVVPDDFDRELVNILIGTKKLISIVPEEGSQFLRKLSKIKDFQTLIAVPLFIEEKISAVLYIEDIPRTYFENFIILTGQFAIQFQKVILYKKVQDMAITDSLTEISTRRHFLERFSEEIRRSMHHKLNLSFLMLDLDRFKEKNDRFGHLVGDVILKEVASILKSNLREIDVIGRYGGEEFAIVLAGIDKDGAFQVAERIRQNIEGTVFKTYDEVVSMTVSIGISVFPDNGIDIAGLIETADSALYKAKEMGRNRVCC